MNRREVAAGVGSLAIFGAGSVIATGHVPSWSGGGSGSRSDREDGGPIEIETIDAPGSEAGTATVPDGEHPTLVFFFVTGCGNCKAQMPPLADARAQLDEETVRFLSATYQSRDTLSEDTLAEWWGRFDGDWAVGYNGTELSRNYGVIGYPQTAIIDAEGTLAWRTDRPTILSADEILAAVESVTGDAEGDGGRTSGDGDDESSEGSGDDEGAGDDGSRTN